MVVGTQKDVTLILKANDVTVLTIDKAKTALNKPLCMTSSSVAANSTGTVTPPSLLGPTAAIYVVKKWEKVFDTDGSTVLYRPLYGV